MHNPSINIPLHITAAEGYFKIITSLYMHTTGLKKDNLILECFFIVIPSTPKQTSLVAMQQ
jgi:hypothetical protein